MIISVMILELIHKEPDEVLKGAAQWTFLLLSLILGILMCRCVLFFLVKSNEEIVGAKRALVIILKIWTAKDFERML